MRFNTHDRTPRPKMSNSLKVLFAICLVLVYSFFVLAAFSVIIYSHNFTVGVSLLLLPFILTTIVAIIIFDLLRAYVEVSEDSIVVVDYYFGIKKEKHYSFLDIKNVKAEYAYSFRIRGYRMRGNVQYLVFRGSQNKYLFKVANFPEAREFFEKYFTISDC